MISPSSSVASFEASQVNWEMSSRPTFSRFITLWPGTFCVFIDQTDHRISIPMEKRWRQYILPQYHRYLTQPIKYKENDVFATKIKIIVVVIFALVLKTMCMLCLNILKLSCTVFMSIVELFNCFRVLRNTSKCTQNNNVQAESIDSATKNDSLSTLY